MSPTDELIPILKKLRMSGVLQSLQERTRQAVEDDLAHSEFLYYLLHDEIERREAKQLSLRLKRASFEHNKSLEDFDFAFNPNVPKAKILELATCAFVDKRENILLVGQTGVGKSHIAQALGHRACMAGHLVLYT
jgi:DNA replication protein DnaC